MSKINFYVGLNVQDLKFECGGGPVGFEAGVVRYDINGTYRHLVEQGLHARKIAEKVFSDIKYCHNTFDLNITTHSDVAINLVGHLISKNKIKAADVKVFILSDDNQNIQQESSFDEKGFLVNWPYGFMEPDISEVSKGNIE